MYYEAFMSFDIDFTFDFYKSCEFYGFCSDIGLFEAVFAPLLKGGKFFLLVSILGIYGIKPLPLVALSICDLR